MASRPAPVEGVEHLYGNQDGESHGHGVEVVKHLARGEIGKVWIVSRALHVVTLGRGGGDRL